MSVTNVYKKPSSQAVEVVISHGLQRADDDHAFKLSAASAVQGANIVNKLGNDRIPLIVRKMRANDLRHANGNRAYVLQDLVKFSAHIPSRNKNYQFSRVRKGVEYIVICAGIAAVIMVGPILQTLGIIGG